MIWAVARRGGWVFLNHACCFLTKISGNIFTLLRSRELPDYGGAMNGLQLQNTSGRVVRWLAEVDASQPVMQKAAAFRVSGAAAAEGGERRESKVRPPPSTDRKRFSGGWNGF